MDTLLFVAGLFGFGPALAVLWYVLRDYDYPRAEKALFSDTKVFLMVAIGMVIGTVIYIIEGQLYQTFRAPGAFDIGMFLLMYVVLFCLVEEGGKLMVLLFPALRKNFDVVFYGVALGCGMAAVAVLEAAFVAIGQKGELPEPLWFVALTLYSITFAMLHASTGAIIADGSRVGDPWPALIKAFSFRALVALCMLPYFMSSNDNLWLSIPFMLVVSFMIFWYVKGSVIPNALPNELKPERQPLKRKRIQ